MPPGTQPKLTIEKFADGGVACLKFVGTIDESFEGKKLGATAQSDTLVIDLGGVKKISSFGIREWVDFVTTAAKQTRQMILIECAPKVVDQLNMVANFAGGGRVFSFYAPFRCDYCDSEHRVLLQVDRDHETIKTMKLAERPCPSCKESMYFDEDGATFFSYVIGQERFELEPAVEAFLASKLNYAVSDLNRKLRVDKVIEGRVTYLRLAGDLDGTFPREKLAEGLEGTVIVDLAAVNKIERAGAAEWRSFLTMAAPLVESIVLAAAPPTFVEKLCGRDDLGPKVQLVTVLLPYTCKSCGTTTASTVDVATHYDVLKFATAPELRCTECKHPMQCFAGDVVMALLPNLPKPTANPDLVKSIGILRERAIQAGTQKKPTAKTTPAGPMSAQHAVPQRTSLLVPVLAALLAVVLAAGGYLAYQRFTGKDAASAQGSITARSAEHRPAWIATDSPGATTCTDTAGKGISCIAVSSLSARQDDADEESADAALDALANAIAVRITDARWKAAVLPIYVAARDAKLAAFDRDPSNTSARRDVREARHAVAALLRAPSGGAVPAAPTARYWEEYSGADGKRYLAFAQVNLGGVEVGKLVDSYTQPASALGATAVSLFPLIGWRFPRVEHGAVLALLASGPLRDLGLAEGYVVMSVGGRDVGDAQSFAKLATEEHAGLVERGGELRLKVQAADGVPRDFVAAIKAPKVETPTSDHGSRHHGAHETNQTGVNVWDVYNGGKRNGRDDPSQ